jgi:serine protease DegS
MDIGSWQKLTASYTIELSLRMLANMSAVKLRRDALFTLTCVLLGLGIALLAVRLWPGLLDRKPAAAVVTPSALEPVAAAHTPVVARANGEGGLEPQAAGPGSVEATPVVSSYASAVRASAPAVVNIYTEGKITERLPLTGLEQLMPGALPPRYRQRIQQGLGSGVIIDAQGHIVTNNHVIEGADKIQVQLADGRSAAATVVGRDPATDLAVIGIKLPRLPVMQWGRSDKLQVGDVVLAIGSPLGLSQTVTHGIVSAQGRAQLGVALFENFIQTDAAINEGNSGGALVNVRGELIGINTAVLGKNRGAEGLGVAIPVDLVRGVMREILEKGRVVRGWIGLWPVDVGAELAAQLGLPAGSVVVADMYIGSPADKAGLAIEDRLVSIDGVPVRSAQDALTQIALHAPGSTVRLGGERRSQPFTLTVPVVEFAGNR